MYVTYFMDCNDIDDYTPEYNTVSNHKIKMFLLLKFGILNLLLIIFYYEINYKKVFTF